MIVAHVLGLPVEESVLQLAPAGAAILTAVTIAVRTTLDRLRSTGSSGIRAGQVPRERSGRAGRDGGR
jgi:hypothetical protein